MPFRFAASNVFLTYSNQEGGWGEPNLQDLFEHLKSFTNKPIKYIVASKEQHQDGSPHFHAFISFARRIDTTNPRFFDYNGWHPKVEAVRSCVRAVSYVKKDGEFLEEGELTGKQHHTACESMDQEQWDEYCITNRISFAYSRAIWNRVHPERNGSITEEDDFSKGTVHPPLDTFEYDFSKSLLLVGPSGCGKTLWSKRNVPKPCLFVSHLDRLGCFQHDYHKSIIFDDMSFKHFPIQSQIHLVDIHDDRDIHIRYKTAHIPSNTIKVFTCNEYPFERHPAIERRLRTFIINNFI